MEITDIIVMLINFFAQLFPDSVPGYIGLALQIVGAASALFIALEKIADITPTDKDNIAIGKAKRYLAKVLAVIDRLALNPDAKGAREHKDD